MLICDWSGLCENVTPIHYKQPYKIGPNYQFENTNQNVVFDLITMSYIKNKDK